jgi:C-terminal processing protease CtpA/Prc
MKIILILLIIFTCSNCGIPEDNEFDTGSRVIIADLNDKMIDDLELLGRAWGFLKYHHPTVADGKYNWDYELFRVLPNYLNLNEKKDSLLIDWIDSLGNIKRCNSCQTVQENAILKPDLEWIGKRSKELENKIINIYQNRTQGNQHYLEMNRGGGKPNFVNENAYSNMPYPDVGYRLLSLYRYWNIINYFSPYRNVMDKDWDTVLAEYIPVFVNAENELEYELAVLKLVGEVQDTHANLYGGADKISEWKGNYYAPVQLRFIEDKLVVTDYFNPEFKDEVGLEIGDIITKINGKTIDQILTEKLIYYPASNIPTKLRNISEEILRSTKNEIEIHYRTSIDSSDKIKNIDLHPKESLNLRSWFSKDEDKASFKILHDNIGYITLETIKSQDIPAIKDQFKDTKGIIIDIRNYPATYVPFSLGSYFVSSSTPFVKFSMGNVNHPGEFTFKPFRNIKNEGETYTGKLVVLVNELTQSQAEFTAMAFRSGNNTTIVGSTTAGADGDVSRFTLPGGLSTAISGIGIYYPDGEETQRVGIIPDIEVKPTIEGIRKGNDELLEKAFEVILNEKSLR